MKLTKQKLKQIIKEELSNIMIKEGGYAGHYEREPEPEPIPDDLIALSGKAIKDAIKSMEDCQSMIEQLLSTEGSGAFMAFSTHARMVDDALEDLLERHTIAAGEHGRFGE